MKFTAADTSEKKENQKHKILVGFATHQTF
jgi:hypothetical protein